MSRSPSSDTEAKVECATCQRCKPSCPSQVDLPEVMRLRRYLDRPQGSHRDAFILTQKMLARSEAAPWLSPELDTGRDDIHYFPGCLPIMDELIEGFTDFRRAAVAGVALMNHLGVSPRIVYGCCGHDLYYSGNLEHFELIRKRLSSIEGRVVTGCAECFHSLKALHGLDAVHVATFLEERLGEVPPEGSARKATFHDPCRLGRHHGIYDPPRKVLAHVGELREMADSRESAPCCGVSAWMNCNPASKKARVERLVQASETGAEVLVTACSKCRTHLSCVYREESYSGHPPELEIVDLQEYVADALGLKVPECSIAASRGRRLSPVTERAELQGMLTKEDVDNVFACTTCGRCEVECEYSYEAAGDVEWLRARLCSHGSGPEEHAAIAARVRATGNVFGAAGAFSRPRPGAEYVYFPGCVAMFRRPSLLKDTIQVLEALGVDFEVPLGLECCGSVLRRTGHGMDRARERNMRLLEGRKVITSCAGCYSTLRDDYKGLEAMHISEMLAPRMGGLGLHEVRMTVAYHDPCHLGRGMGVYEEPREALRAIPGLEVMEMAEAKEGGRCCGGGGGVRSARRDISARLAMERCAEARGRGAEAIATSCPFCELNLGEQMPTEDVVELVARSLRGGGA